MTVHEAPVFTDTGISKLIHDYLDKKREAEGKREIAGGRTWRASKLGSCLKAQYLEFALKQPPTFPDDAKSTKRFEVGDVWGEIFRRWFDGMGLLLHEELALDDPKLDVGAHVDFIIGNGKWKAGIELKSMQSRYFWHRINEGRTEIATDGHLIQAATYDLLSRQQGVTMPWYVVVVSKDDLTIEQSVVREEHREMALQRLHALNTAKALGVAPPCECTDEAAFWGGREWRWCSFYGGSPESRTESKSVKTDEKYANGKAKYKKVFTPDGECCVEAVS